MLFDYRCRIIRQCIQILQNSNYFNPLLKVWAYPDKKLEVRRDNLTFELVGSDAALHWIGQDCLCQVMYHAF